MGREKKGRGGGRYLRDTLLVLSAVECGPCDSARVFALQEEGFGFASLESEDFTISAHVEFPLGMS